MKILVTGGAGFIGSHLVRALVAEGHEVTVIDSLTEQVHGKQSYRGEPIDKWSWDRQPFENGVRSYPWPITHDGYDGRLSATALREKYDAVYHLAAFVGVGQAQYNLAGYVENNVLQTAEMLQYWIDNLEYRPGRLIVASSMSIYGENPTEPVEIWECGDAIKLPPDGYKKLTGLFPRATKESDPPQLPNIYAQTKYDQERYCLLFGDAYNVPTVAARFFNVYGPGQSLSNPYTGVAAIFAACLLAGIDAPIFDDGLQTRDFIHVSDIVSGLMAMLHAPAEKIAGEAINLGTGRITSLLTLHLFLAGALGKGHVAPKPTGIKRKGDIRHCHADITKAQKLLDWTPQVKLEDGIDEYAQWLKTQDVSGVLERVEQMRRELAEKGLVNG